VQGFYTVYREVFEGLSKHESEAAERAGKKGPSPASFGLSDSPWSEVSAFYRYWLQFVSDREFGWADVHNLASAPNRKLIICPSSGSKSAPHLPGPSRNSNIAFMVHAVSMPGIRHLE
jgi:hypothetical protein